MLKELIENKCIDIGRLLLLRAKELQIEDMNVIFCYLYII